MKTSRRVMCLILAVVIMAATMGLVSAFADEGGSQTGTSAVTCPICHHADVTCLNSDYGIYMCNVNGCKEYFVNGGGKTESDIVCPNCSATNASSDPSSDTTSAPNVKVVDAKEGICHCTKCDTYFVAETQIATTKASKPTNYLTKFDASQSNTILSCNQMSALAGFEPGKSSEWIDEDFTTEHSSIKYNDDGSMTLTKSSYTDKDTKGNDVTKIQNGLSVEVKVTDAMREAFKNATDNKLIISYYLSDAKNASGYFTDSQFRIYAKYKTSHKVDVKDTSGNVTGTTDSYLKSSSLGSDSVDCYEQNIDKEFTFEEATTTDILTSLDDVESIIISFYHYSGCAGSLEVSGIAVSGSPEIKEFVDPTPNAVDSQTVLLSGSSYYDRSWSNAPSSYKYQDSTGIYRSNGSGNMCWLQMDSEASAKELTKYYFFDRDVYNKGIVTANQTDGTRTAQITVDLTSVTDTADKEMDVQIQVQLMTYDYGTITAVEAWQKSGTSKTYQFDTSKLSTNSLQYFKVGIMNYWKYSEADDMFYDWDKKTVKDDKTYCIDENGQTVDVTNKTLNMRYIYNMEAYISSIDVVSSNPVTTTTAKKTTTSSSDDYKYSGYHFYDFTNTALNESYGNSPRYVNFLNDTYYQQFKLSNHTYTDGNVAGTKVDQSSNSSYLTAFKNASSMLSKGYQVELNSGDYKESNCQVQYQISFFPDAASEDEQRVSSCADHGVLKAQNDTYDYYSQMKNAVKYANNNTIAANKGFLAIDYYIEGTQYSGYKNSNNDTYKAWCKANNKKCTDENASIELQVSIHANNPKTKEDESIQVMTSKIYNTESKSGTLFLDVSELDASHVTGVRLVAQNYEAAANSEQGGNGNLCGFYDAQVKFSSIYVPGKSVEQVTTPHNTEPANEKDRQNLVKLFKTVPNFTASALSNSGYKTYKDLYNHYYNTCLYNYDGDDLAYYQSQDDWEVLGKFLAAYDSASDLTKYEFVKSVFGDKSWTDDDAQEFAIKLYIYLTDLELRVYDTIGAGDNWDTNDIAFPVIAVIAACAAGYVVLRTRKKNA